MIRDDYKVIKAKVVASCKYYTNYYELQVWFPDTDLTTRGCIYNIGMSTIKDISGVKRGDGFKKIQTFLNTDEGKEWLEKELKEQDIRVETRNIKDSISVSTYRMTLEQLREYDKIGKQITNRTE